MQFAEVAEYKRRGPQRSEDTRRLDKIRGRFGNRLIYSRGRPKLAAGRRAQLGALCRRHLRWLLGSSASSFLQVWVSMADSQMYAVLV